MNNYFPEYLLKSFPVFQNRFAVQATQDMIALTDENRAFLMPNTVLDPSPSDPGYFKNDTYLSNLLHKEFNLLESKSDKEKKELALLRLNDILKHWMNQVHQQLGIKVDPNTAQAVSHSAILLCYGSYKLGVSTPSGDMDTLVLVPTYVERNKHFFGLLFGILEQKARENEHIKDLTSINYEHSITPLIKMVFYDVSVDMVFASVDDVSALNGEIKPSGLSIRANLYNDSFLQSIAMDEKMQRSYNGFRNAEMILNSMFTLAEKKNDSLVEQRIHNFRMCLRCLKQIAKMGGINENKFGYLGGIAFALLTAKIVQLFPNYTYSHLLEKFFYVYGNCWDWNNWPVMIVDELKEANVTSSSGYPKMPVSESVVVFDYNWNGDKRRNNRQGNFQGYLYQPPMIKRYMNIVTPAWPQMNSSYNISFSTRAVIINLFKKKYSEILAHSAQKLLQNEQFQYSSWLRFFRQFEFLKAYDQYIEIIIVCNDNSAQFLKWKGFIESKIRLLLDRLEGLLKMYNFDIQLWPFAYNFEEVRLKQTYHPRLHSFHNKEKLYIGLRTTEDYSDMIDLRGAISGFMAIIKDKWTRENKAWDHDHFDLFIYLIEPEMIQHDLTKPNLNIFGEEQLVYGDYSNYSNGLNVNMLRSVSVGSENEIVDTKTALNQLLD